MFKKLGIAAGLSVFAGSAFATGPSAGDLSTLTPDASTILTAILAVAAVMLGVRLAVKAYRVVASIFNR